MAEAEANTFSVLWSRTGWHVATPICLVFARCGLWKQFQWKCTVVQKAKSTFELNAGEVSLIDVFGSGCESHGV